MGGEKNLVGNMKGLKVAILGLGEAGSHFAKDLVNLGVNVSGYDPVISQKIPEEVRIATSAKVAIEGADIVFSVNLSSVSIDLATELADALQAHQFFCEMNTSGPEKKKKIASILENCGVKVIDLAIMAPVPPKGMFTPLLASGTHATELEAILKPLGLQISVVENGLIGDAATRKLLRSIVYKGMAAVICEAMEAGETFGMESYMRGQISSLMGGDDELIDRFVEGSRIHAKRRKDEMEAVIEMLEAKGIDPIVTTATKNNLQKLIK
jgi:3-hydroxyisobutyrate dehydrogenase-like beta-hydroxyacid dehydrogenase